MTLMNEHDQKMASEEARLKKAAEAQLTMDQLNKEWSEKNQTQLVRPIYQYDAQSRYKVEYKVGYFSEILCFKFQPQVVNDVVNINIRLEFGSPFQNSEKFIKEVIFDKIDPEEIFHTNHFSFWLDIHCFSSRTFSVQVKPHRWLDDPEIQSNPKIQMALECLSPLGDANGPTSLILEYVGSPYICGDTLGKACQAFMGFGAFMGLDTISNEKLRLLNDHMSPEEWQEIDFPGAQELEEIIEEDIIASVKKVAGW